MNNNFLLPQEIAEYTVQTGMKKVKTSYINMLILGILAGAFIAFGGEGSNMAAFNLLSSPTTYGIGKALAGATFTTGLMMVLIAGGELFTGNTMILAGVLDGKIKVSEMVINWIIVYIGNFIGAVLIAYAMNKTGLFASGANGLGAMTIKIAASKVGFTFGQAFILGILCNILVCLAVWMSYSAKDITGKIFAVFFPIWLFVTSGFEHSIANMYYIPAGIIAKGNNAFVQAALSIGVTPEKLAHLNWQNFLIKNLVPVTLGNIVGGSIFVAGTYWFVYIKGKKDK